ncbi:MAG: tetratricopeptide repeat protein [Planctomycetota bacterium]
MEPRPLRTALAIACLAVLATPAGVAIAQTQDTPAPPPSETPAEPNADPVAETPREATVVLQDGQVLTGRLLEQTDARVVLRINGVRTTIDTRRIRELYIRPPVDQRHRAFRLTIADDDVEGLIRLAEWAIEQGRPDLAINDLERALEVDPFSARARELRTVAREAQRLIEAQRPAEPAPSPSDSGEPGDQNRPDQPATRTPAKDRDTFPLIDADDVNIIRVFEVDLDRPPRLRIERSAMEAVFEDFAGHPGVPSTEAGRQALLDAPPSEQLALLFRLRAREHYANVQVLAEPDALRRFRDDVFRGWLSNSCSTTRCHGGTEAGRLRLANAGRTDPRVYLTNLVILERFRTEDGSPLIDFEEPASSLLLQAGLPRHAAAVPHPEVRGWRPVFRGATDGNFGKAVRWIEGMYVPRPAYSIDYTPPAASEPSPATPGPPR